jgi:two-component sensor histidine kinase/CheY-like chemotaxis protein
MGEHDKVNILMVDDQPAKLLSYESILGELGENLIKAGSGREALGHLLKADIAVVLMDVSMPELDGFELAEMIHQHPRYQRTAIIFISAVHLTDLDQLRGYAHGAVDYISVPIIPELLRAKVSVFAELYRKTQQLERLNRELEQRVAERTAALEASTERLKAALHEKEVLLKEIHHRVKNNLQIIASLLSLQSRQLKDPADLVLFEDTQRRVMSMALIHGSLYRTGDLAHFSFARYINSLCTDLLQSYADGTSHVHLHTELDELTFDVDTAVPCGLILNELLTNALKYAFPDGRSGDIHIMLRAQAGHVTLRVHDTGVGFPADLDFRHTESLGMKLVSMLTEQLGGTITLTSECGTAFAVTFPYDSLHVGGDAHAPPQIFTLADERIIAAELNRSFTRSG